MHSLPVMTRLSALAAILVACHASAATVLWGGGNMTWSEPDNDSWDAQYNTGDTVQFLGAGLGTITVEAAGVMPGNMTFTGDYTLAGGTISGAGRLDKNSGTLTLSNTNTYSGNTTLNSGTLRIEAASALSPSTKVISKRNTTLSIRTDDSGPVNLGNEVEISSIDTSSGVISQHSIDVRNNGGSTVGTTIILGTADFSTGDMRPSRQFNVTGSDGYTLQFGDVSINPAIGGTTLGGPNRFNPSSASIIIAGTVKALNGDTGVSATDNNLYLGGIMTGNLVSGEIADPDDYPGNSSAEPLNVYKGETGDWTLAGTNTYTGTTTIKAGTLHVTGSLNSNSTTTVSNTGSLVGTIAGTGTVGTVILSGTGSIRLLNDLVATLSVVGNLNINGLADANNLYLDLGTGGNGTDKITVIGNVTMATPGAGVINLNQLSGSKINAGTYDLITATGTMVGVANFALATTSAFGNNFALQLDGTSKKLQLVVTAATGAPAVAFWEGGGADNNWSTLFNWATDASGSTPVSAAPGYNTDINVHAVGAARLTTGTLDTDFDINSLTYTTNATANTTIASAANTLMLEAASGTGLTVNTPTSGTPSHTISASMALPSSQTWTVNSNASLTVNGVISDFSAGNSLTKAGGGELMFSALNEYQGATIINEGTLKIWHLSLNNSTVPNALGMSSSDASNLLLGDGATLEFVISADTYKSTDRRFTINGTTDGASATLAISGSANRGVNLANSASPAYGTPDQTRTLILDSTHTTGGNTYGFIHQLTANVADNGSGAVSIVKNGVGAWKLIGNSSFSGGVTLNQGTLRIGNNNNILGVGTVTMAGGTLVVDDDRTLTNPIALDGDAPFFTSEGTTARSLTLNGIISGTGRLIKTSVGILSLAAANTYSGETIVTNGTLELIFNKALPSSTILRLYSGGTTGLVYLPFTGKQKLGGLYIDDVEQPYGVYAANGTTITGTGALNVGRPGTVVILR